MSEQAANNSPNGENGNGRLVSIKEVSALTGVPPHTLRFWEKQMPEILRPERTPGGQRRYSPQMVDRARAIKRLSDEKKYSLTAIRNHLAAESEIFEPMQALGRRIGAEQAVDMIIHEVASLLRDRLLNLFEPSGPPKSSGSSLDRTRRREPCWTQETK